MTVIKRDEEARPQLETPVLRIPSSLGDRSIYFSEKILDFGQTQIGTLYRLKATICNPCDTKVGLSHTSRACSGNPHLTS
jgi:hypothetical protein